MSWFEKYKFIRQTKQDNERMYITKDNNPPNIVYLELEFQPVVKLKFEENKSNDRASLNINLFII